MSSYWNHEFKHGSPPTITSPALFWWHRHTPIASQPTNDPLGKDDSCDSLTDTIYAVVFVPEGSPAAQLVITSASLVALRLFVRHASDSFDPSTSCVDGNRAFGRTSDRLG